MIWHGVVKYLVDMPGGDSLSEREEDDLSAKGQEIG